MTFLTCVVAGLTLGALGCSAGSPDIDRLGDPLDAGSAGDAGDAGTAGTTGAPSATTSTASTGGSSSSSSGWPVRTPSSGDGTCTAYALQAKRVVPNMLIVLDRSASMIENASNTDRWKGSVDAINTVVDELEDRLRFGLMTYPQSHIDDGGVTRDACKPGALDEPMQVFNGAPIAGTLDSLSAAGATPTAQTLGVAAKVLEDVDDEDARTAEFVIPNKYVMLVTDGDPNCFTYSDDPDPEAQQASIAAVQALAGTGVKTYVIGFQTAESDFAHVLDDMAAVGGTGDAAHRSVDTGAELLDEFRRIAGAAVSCSFVLPFEVEEDHVEVTIDGAEAEYGTDWDLLDDGYTIELLEPACNALQKDGAQVEAQILCEPVRLI